MLRNVTNHIFVLLQTMMLMDRPTAENNLKVAQMMLDEISEDGEVEERQEEVDELLDFIIRMKKTLEELSD